MLDVLDDELVAQIRRDVLETGGVLLRGFDVAGPADFERVLLRLGYDLLDDYTPADVRRNAVGGCRCASSRRRSRRTATGSARTTSSRTRGDGRASSASTARSRRRRAAAASRQSSRRATASPRSDDPTRAQLRVPVKHGRVGRAPGRPRPAAPLRAERRPPLLPEARRAQIFDFLSTWLHPPLPNLRHHPPWQQVFRYTEDEAEAEARVAARAQHALRWSMEWKALGADVSQAHGVRVGGAHRRPPPGDGRRADDVRRRRLLARHQHLGVPRSTSGRVRRTAARCGCGSSCRGARHRSWLTVLKVPFAVRAFVADKVCRPWLRPRARQLGRVQAELAVGRAAARRRQPHAIPGGAVRRHVGSTRSSSPGVGATPGDPRQRQRDACACGVPGPAASSSAHRRRVAEVAADTAGDGARGASPRPRARSASARARGRGESDGP